MSTLTDLLSISVARAPDAVAVAEDERRITYTQLWAAAGRQANALHTAGLAGEAVLLALSPGIAWVTALLGAWRAGAAAVPVDVTHPPERLARLARGCHAAGAITRTGRAPAWASTVTAIAGTMPGPVGQEPHKAPPGDDAVACLWHTSGSTGTPKPVPVPHRAVASRAAAMPHLATIISGDRIAQLTSPSFDAVLWEVLCALTTGAHLQIASAADRTPGPALAAFLARHRITAFTCTPTQLAATPAVELPHLRRIVLGGEALHPGPVAWWLERHEVANAYGPTEVCVQAFFADRIRPDDDPVPIGRPLPGVLACVLDEHRRPVAAGLPGELYLGGDGLATGYLGMPAATEQAFLDLRHPGDSSHSARHRLYRTGDRVRALPDGQLTFLGRIDDQINLGGVRLEPGEVEACAVRMPGIRAAALLAEPASNGRRPRLVLHIEGVQGEDTEHLPTALRLHLARQLPPTAVPALIICHTSLPRTASGKIDRRNLAGAPLPPAPASSNGAVLPEAAAGWWQQWTGSPPDQGRDFFAAGGDSLTALAFLQLLNEHYGTAITLDDFYARPTTQFLADHLAPKSPS
ncbi:non-ribosomal peptide synthetase [Sphaerisporangium sp. NPDC049003]|uniref:non-ribosomal peptide synthetase n=1 Tax=Sphaerisporangium sp. NPDC049003 TaxID=3364517 RepID=UPI003710EE6D